MNKEVFIYGLALSNEYGLPINEETIYYPEAYLVGKVTVNGKVEGINISLPFGRCTLDDFGENFKKFVKDMPLLNEYYCFKNFDIDFEGYSSAENFTSILINIKKCENKTGQAPCKDEEEIRNSLNRKNLIVFSENFDLTPYDYEKPVKEKLTINNCPIRLDQLQTFVGYYQLTNIVTENNLFGFEVFSDIKSEKYIIYHSALIMSYEIYKGQKEVITYNIMLKENSLTNKRTYVQLIDILGDIGGLMEVIESILGIICSFITDILYDKVMVNNLFSFNLNTNTAKIKTQLKRQITANSQHNNNDNSQNNKTLIFNNNDNYNINNCNENNNNNKLKHQETLDKTIFDLSKKNTMKSNQPNSSIKKTRLKKRVKHLSGYIFNNINSSERSAYIKSNIGKSSIKSILKDNYENKELENEVELNDLNLNDNGIKIYENNEEKSNKIFDQKKIITKLDASSFYTYFCFCCIRKRQNIGNALLDEALGIITDKLDIYNMFRNFYYIDEIKTKSNYEYKEFEISNECKQKLKEVSHKIYDSFFKI